MGQKAKTILTVLIAIGCSFLFIVCAGVFSNYLWEVKYRTENKADVEIENISLSEIKASDIGDTNDKFRYYMVKAVIRNDYNVDKEGNKIYFYYGSNMSEKYYEIRELDDNTFFPYDNIQLIPAGKEAVITRVIAVEQGCTQIQIDYRNYYTKAEQSFEFIL